MEQVFLNFFSLQTMVFCIVIYLIVQTFRSIIEAIAKAISSKIPQSVKTVFKDFWSEGLLASLPILVGGLLAWKITQYPYPDGFQAPVARVFFGLAAGGASGFVYRLVKFYMNKYLPDDIKEKIAAISSKITGKPPVEKTPEQPVVEESKEEPPTI